MFSNFLFLFFRKSCPLWDNVKECGTARQVRGHYNTAHKLRLHKHILRICNAHCFYTTTMVAQTRLNVVLYVHCLSSQFAACD
jgi:hypothetical protein